MTNHMVVIRRKAQSTLEIVEKEIKSVAGAETYAQDLYRDLQLDTVMVVKVDVNTGLTCLMKIVRHCKHLAIQGDFFLAEGRMRCEGCGMVFKPEAREVRSIVE